MQAVLQPAVQLHHPARAITTLSVSSHAQLYALGSRSGMYLYSTHDAFDASQRSSSSSPSCVQLLYADGEADVAVGAFNPHQCAQSVIATSSGPSLYLWDLNSPLHPLQSAHAAQHGGGGSQQQVRSLGWSHAHPLHFATVGAQRHADLLVWDTRDTTAPLVALPCVVVPPSSHSSAFTPSSSHFVAFHPSVSYLLASSSDTAIRIWDLRYPAGSVDSFQSPLAAPLGSLCWSRWQWRHLLSANHSQQVEVWSIDDTAAEQRPVAPLASTSSAERLTYQLQTKDALLSASSTPFGHGLVTRCRANTDLQLWSVGTRLGQSARGVEVEAASADVTEVARLSGGSSPVQLVDWYVPGTASLHSASSSVGVCDDTATQLWAVCEDRTLRVYDIPATLRRACGEAAEDGCDDFTDAETEHVADCASLRSELSYCQRALPSFQYHSFSPSTRSCAAVVSSSQASHSLLLQITFPPSYPSVAPPVFAIQPGSSALFFGVGVAMSNSFLHQLSALCCPYIERAQRCLLPALTFLQHFVHDTVASPPVIVADGAAGAAAGGRKVRIEERRELRERKQPQPFGIRKGVVSASTPSLTSLSSSVSPASRPSTSLTQLSPLPLDEDSSPAAFNVSSAEQSDEEDMYSRNVSAASSTSAMHTMVEEEDEETADEAEGGVRSSQRAAAAASDSKKRKEQRDFELLCPRLCGVSWGPRGELVMFNNFPALTHYIQQTREQRRLRTAHKQPRLHGTEGDEKTDAGRAALASPDRTHHRHTSLQHDEDEWNDINQADGDVDSAALPASSHLQQPPSSASSAERQADEAGKQLDRTMDVFPPRTFGHLLQLPFLASYLEPVLRETTVDEHGIGARALVRGMRAAVDSSSDSDAVGLAAATLEAALAVEQSAADGNSSSDSDDEEQTVNLNAVPLSSLAELSGASSQQRTHARIASTTSSIGSISPSHSRHASVGDGRAASSSPPIRPASPSLLPSVLPAVSLSLRPSAVAGAAGHDRQLASSSIVALPVHTSVLITDLSCLFPVDATLSASYPLLPPRRSSSIDTASELCAAFERTCEQQGRHDLVQMWQLLSLVFRPSLLDDDAQAEGAVSGPGGWSEGWAGGAWTGGLVQRLMSDCWQQGDIESVGLIACVLSLVPTSRLLTPRINITASHQPFVLPPPPPTTSPSPPSAPRSTPFTRSVSSQVLRPSFPVRSLSALPLHLSTTAGTVPLPILRSQSGSSDGAHDRSPLSASSSAGFFASTSLPNPSYYSSMAAAAALSQSPSFGPSSPVVAGSPQHLASPSSVAAVAAVLSVSISVYDLYKLLYAEWLSRLGLMLHRAAVLKCCDSQQSGDVMEVLTGWNSNELHAGFDALCQRCGQALAPSSHTGVAAADGSLKSSPVRCDACNLYSAHCAVCHLSVRGLSSYCLQCGHGGHMAHMQGWFDGGEKECATGCGCMCTSTS